NRAKSPMVHTCSTLALSLWLPLVCVLSSALRLPTIYAGSYTIIPIFAAHEYKRLQTTAYYHPQRMSRPYFAPTLPISLCSHCPSICGTLCIIRPALAPVAMLYLSRCEPTRTYRRRSQPPTTSTPTGPTGRAFALSEVRR